MLFARLSYWLRASKGFSSRLDLCFRRARARVFVLTLSAFMAATVVPASAAEAGRRVALLLGNGAYTSVPRLNNPRRDVAAMKVALEKAGFDAVVMAVDLDKAAMVRALREFEDRADGAEIGVIFYSGHAVELAGQNYLIPVNGRLGHRRDVDDESIAMDRLMRALEGVSRLRLVILDACRDNPFLQTMAGVETTRSLSRGLGRIEPPQRNTLIAYAARAGTVATDGDGTNSPFTAALVKHLAEPGLDVRLALGMVRDDVLAATNNVQEPFLYGSLGGGSLPLSKVAPAPPQVDPLVTEAAAVWPSLAGSTDLAALAAFQERYRGTFYETLARDRIAALGNPTAAAQSAELPARRPTVPATVPPAAAPAKPETLAPATAGDYVVHVASQRSEADALNSWRALQAKYPNLMGSYRATVRRADLGDKGVFFRAVVGPFATREQANDLCQSLRTQGGDCVVQKNAMPERPAPTAATVIETTSPPVPLNLPASSASVDVEARQAFAKAKQYSFEQNGLNISVKTMGENASALILTFDFPAKDAIDLIISGPFKSQCEQKGFREVVFEDPTGAIWNYDLAAKRFTQR